MNTDYPGLIGAARTLYDIVDNGIADTMGITSQEYLRGQVELICRATGRCTDDYRGEVTRHIRYGLHATDDEPWCNHDPAGVTDGRCECGVIIYIAASNPEPEPF